MDHSVDLKEIRAILVIARAGSITRAARDLSIGQPDLSRLLRRLEKKLDLTLLVRHGRGVRLTPEGAVMAANADQVLALMREAAVAINASAEVLKLAAVPPPHTTFVTPRTRYARVT
jgi:LysR family transcriptional regulator, nitrogen assimilation regulatory protein